VRGYKMPPLIFSPQEATAIYLGAGLVDEVWGDVYMRLPQGAIASLIMCSPTSNARKSPGRAGPLVATGLHRL